MSAAEKVRAVSAAFLTRIRPSAVAALPILRGPLADIHAQAPIVLFGGLMRVFMSIGLGIVGYVLLDD